MRQWRHEEPSRDGAPLRFGSATPEQQHDLFIDFAPATVAVVVAMVPLVEVSVLAYVVVAGLTGAVLLMWLRRRTAKAAVLIEADELQVRNVFRSYRIPIAGVTKVVNRQSWVLGIYASCFGVRTRRRLDALPGRSVPLHALSGSARQEHELRVLLQLDPPDGLLPGDPTDRSD